MIRSKWPAINSNLYFSDNSTLRLSSDKLHRLRFFLNSLRRKLKSIPCKEKVCVDEQIIIFEDRNILEVCVQKSQRSGINKYLHFVILLVFFLTLNYSLARYFMTVTYRISESVEMLFSDSLKLFRELFIIKYRVIKKELHTFKYLFYKNY
jgi:hypothetical protein